MENRKIAIKNQMNGHNVWDIGIYVRLSKDDGNDESLSIINQKKIINEYLEVSFEEDYRLVDIYIDDGISGTTDDARTDFIRMIEDVKQKKINCIITKTLARTFRNYADQGYYLEEFFPLYQTRFICLGSPSFDTYKNPESILDSMDVPITGLMNDRYAARTSSDIRKTFNTKRRNGEFIGAFAPYGYRKDPNNKNKLLVDEEVAPIIRNIFQWYVTEGMSKTGIVRHLNELGIPTPTDYKHSKGLMLKTPLRAKNDGMWGVSTVSHILSNPLYIGTMIQGRQRMISYKVHKAVVTHPEEWFVVENTHEPIVCLDLFEKAQSLSKRTTRIGPKKKKLYLFSGFLRCADCGKSMTKKTNRKVMADGTVKEYVYYICSTYAFKSRQKCSRHTISLEDLSKAVLQAIQVQITLVSNMSEVISEIHHQPAIQQQSTQLRRQLDLKEEELSKKVNGMDSLYIDWKCGDITKSEYIRMKTKFQEKIEEVEETIHYLKSEMKKLSKGIGVDDPYLQLFLKHKTITTLNRGLLVELVDKISIHENKEITIRFNFMDQYKRIIEFMEQNQKNPNENK